MDFLVTLLGIAAGTVVGGYFTWEFTKWKARKTFASRENNHVGAKLLRIHGPNSGVAIMENLTIQRIEPDEVWVTDESGGLMEVSKIIWNSYRKVYAQEGQ